LIRLKSIDGRYTTARHDPDQGASTAGFYARRHRSSSLHKENSMTTRRSFIQILPLAGALALCAKGAIAADAAAVDPKDPQAAALGYVTDATKADKAKFPKYAAGQACGGCQLYQGKPGDATGGCAIFAGKKVSSKGWCSAYMKKA
jgi:hypothetical protein